MLRCCCSEILLATRFVIMSRTTETCKAELDWLEDALLPRLAGEKATQPEDKRRESATVFMVSFFCCNTITDALGCQA